MKNKLTFLILLFFAFNSCVEPFDYKTLTFESALVVEASISSENKKQTIKLSRTFKIEDSDIIPETGATVEVVDDQNNTFNFTEDTPGNYISDVSFEAKKNISYQLKIKTKDDRTYTSNNQKITGVSPIQDLIAKAVTSNANGISKEGIAIYVESNDPDRNSNYYRFEYEETYKIVAPLWVPREIKIISRVWPFKTKLIFREKEEKNCFKTTISNNIIQTETFTLSEDRVNFPVKFIQKSDFSIRNRYSLFVKQYIQSREAFAFYKVLHKLSSSESLFSQNQAGTLIGNVISTDNEFESVLGFFEVTSVSSKRVFFNYTDFFDRSTRPKHLEKCFFEEVPLFGIPLDDPPYSPLFYNLDSGKQVYYSGENHPFKLVTRSCGDCTAIGSNIKPAFWID